MGHDENKAETATSRSPLWQSTGGDGRPKADDQPISSATVVDRVIPVKAPRSESNVVGQCTLRLGATYAACNPAFVCDVVSAPRRALTDPSEGVSNGGRDNKNQELIIYVNDELGSHHSNAYLVLGLLGSGTFGQVVKAVHKHTRDLMAVKVIKNHSAYFDQARMEIYILRRLQEKYAKDERFRIVQLYDYFMHYDHLCLVFEMLHVNLYELLRSNHYKGLSLTVIRVFLKQLLNALSILQEVHIIHCDLKPENILLCDPNSAAIKLIDFGSACFEHQTVYTYIQSRYYRSPEVLCGYPYNSKIDMWSLGCILAELFLGLPLFPGVNDYNQMARIAEMCSYPPCMVLEGGKHSSKYFKRVPRLPLQDSAAAAKVADKSAPLPDSPKAEGAPHAAKSPGSKFSLNNMLSLGGSPAVKDRGKKKKAKEELEGCDEVGVEMTTIASYEHLDKIAEPVTTESPEGGSTKVPATSPQQPKDNPGDKSLPHAKAAVGKPPVPGDEFPIIGEWQLKTEDEFSRDTGVPKGVWKRYFNYTQLEDLILHVPYKEQADVETEKFDRVMFADFLRGLLLTDFRERWTAEQALEHPFVAEEGRQLFKGPGRYHSDVVIVENRRVERARQLAEAQRVLPPVQPPQQFPPTPKGHTRSVPIPRHSGLSVAYAASWGSLFGTSPGYSSPPTATAGSGLFASPYPAPSHQRNASHVSNSPSSPYVHNASGVPAPGMVDASLEDLPDHSPDLNLSDSFSFSGSYDPSITSGLAHHLARAQLSGEWPPQGHGGEGGPSHHPSGPYPPHSISSSYSSSGGAIPVPRHSDAMPPPAMGWSLEQQPGAHMFPPSPIVQSPGSFYGAHLHPGAANQLLGLSPTMPGSQWDQYAPYQKQYGTASGQQRRGQRGYTQVSHRERAMSWSAPKPSNLGQLMLANRPVPSSSTSGSVQGGHHGGHGAAKPAAGYQKGSAANDAGRPHGRNRQRKGPPPHGVAGWPAGRPAGSEGGGLPHSSGTGPRAPPQDPPDAFWDPFFNECEP